MKTHFKILIVMIVVATAFTTYSIKNPRIDPFPVIGGKVMPYFKHSCQAGVAYFKGNKEWTVLLNTNGRPVPCTVKYMSYRQFSALQDEQGG